MTLGGQKRSSATRLELARARRRLAQVERARDLLAKKREALVVELFALAAPAAGARERIAAQARAAWSALLEAISVQGREGLRALAWPARELTLEMREAEVWGVPVAEIVSRAKVARSTAARGAAPGWTGPSTTGASAEAEALVELLLDAAPREMMIQRLGDALAATSRRVNVLDQHVRPALAGDADAIRATLDEREREEHVRLEHLLRNKRR